MSGHSKWSTIKRKKGAADAKRGKIFSRLNKEILLAARNGGADLTANIRLRNAVASAKAANMPKDNIERAIKKGSGELDDGTILEEHTYEGYGPAGAAVLVETISDNRNRTTADVRHSFSKFGGNLGENGCVSWMFDRKGLLVFNQKNLDMDALEETAIDGNAEDIKEDEETNTIEVTCALEDYDTLQQAFEKAGFEPEVSELSYIPQSTLKLEGRQAETMLKLMELLEELDDVQNVYSNFDISKEDMEAMS